MKKYYACFVSGLVAALFSASALATNICDGDPTKAKEVAGKADGTTFVRNSFTPKCSNNVVLDFSDEVTSFAVASGSKKGKSVFIGNTVGGTVTPSATTKCPASGCTTTETAAGLTEAIALGGS